VKAKPRKLLTPQDLRRLRLRSLTAAGVVVKRSKKVDSKIAERIRLCAVCQNFDCEIKPLADCQRRRRLKDPSFKCPEGLF